MLTSGENLWFEVYDQPNMRLARAAAGIGSQAWNERFAHRGKDGVRHVFDPAHPEILLDRMRAAAKKGRFVGRVALASDGEYTGPVGFIWGADDISGNAGERWLKRARGQKPYAWIAQLNVLPSYQRNKIGANLVSDFLGEFRPDQQSSVYVFGENKPALQWFRRLGYLTTGATQKDYFGTGREDVEQLRLQAQVGDVRQVIQRLYAPLPRDNT